MHDAVNEAPGQTGSKTVSSWKDPSEYEVQMDQQIQTPNEQTDLDTVEQLMRNHKSVDDAAAVFRDGPDPEIVGFVTLQQSAIESQIGSQRHAGEEYETQQVQLWETVFDKGIIHCHR